MSDFAGLTALVTGAASGIGRATAHLLAGRDAQAAVLGLDPSPVDKPLLALGADVTDDAGRPLDAAPDPVAERGALKARRPTGRRVTAAEAAGALACLASPLSTATTGTPRAVDGGMQGLGLRPAVNR